MADEITLPTVFDVLDQRFRAAGGEDCNEPLKHVFTPGLYTRTIFMRPGIAILSKIHKTEHPFIISQGAVEVYECINGQLVYAETLTAPYMGVTKPGTQRALRVVSEVPCVWSTTHVMLESDFESIETDEATDIERIIIERITARIIEPHVNPLLQSPELLQDPMFAECLRQAQGIVSEHRALAPVGCDPQNTFGWTAATWAVVISATSVVAGIAGSVMSNNAANDAAKTQGQMALLNAQAETQAAQQAGQLGQAQAAINEQLAVNDKKSADENAAALAKEADINSTLAQQGMAKTREDFRRLAAATRVKAAQSGVLDTSGSVYDLLVGQADQEQKAIDKQSYTAEVQRRETLAASADATNQGIMAEISGLSQQARGAGALGASYAAISQSRLNMWGQRAQADAIRNQASGRLMSQAGTLLGQDYSSFRSTPRGGVPSTASAPSGGGGWTTDG